jgi:hypothetical protein
VSDTNSSRGFTVRVWVQVTRKEFKFAAKHNLRFFFVSAADGTNIVKVEPSNYFKLSGSPICVCGVESLQA